MYFIGIERKFICGHSRMGLAGKVPFTFELAPIQLLIFVRSALITFGKHSKY
jgi:hypothetical protein